MFPVKAYSVSTMYNTGYSGLCNNPNWRSYIITKAFGNESNPRAIYLTTTYSSVNRKKLGTDTCNRRYSRLRYIYIYIYKVILYTQTYKTPTQTHPYTLWCFFVMYSLPIYFKSTIINVERLCLYFAGGER